MKRGQLIALRPSLALDELSDPALAAACSSGDRVAQGLMFERFGQSIYRFIAGMRSSDIGNVDDIVQATFIAAFRSAGSFRGSKLQTWLFGIAVNVMRTHVRKDVAGKRIASAFAAQPRLETQNPHDLDLDKLRIAIRELPLKLREVIVLVDIEGENGADVASALGISIGAVWRRLSQGRQRLRLALGGVV
jgi:RNA polymerase sigma factor (sigma-70 family)